MKVWTVKNEEGQDAAEILLYGPIMDNESWFSSGSGAKELANTLMQLNNKPVNLRINSYGGGVFAGHAMMSALKAYGGKVTAYIDGIAASAAVLPALGADKVVMPVNSMMMIHNPMYNIEGAFDQHELQKMGEVLNELKSSIIAAYKTKTHLSEEKLAEMMDADTWMTANNAKEYGFADEVIGLVDISLSKDAVNSNGLSIPLNSLPANAQLVNCINQQNIPKQKEETQKMPDKTNKFDELLNHIAGFFNNSSNEQLPATVNNVAKPVELTSESLKNGYPDIFNQILNDGINQGIAQERKRLQDIDNLANTVPAVFLNKAKYEEPQNAEEMALNYMKNGGAAFNNMKNDVESSNANKVAANGEPAVADAATERATLVNLMVEGGKQYVGN